MKAVSSRALSARLLFHSDGGEVEPLYSSRALLYIIITRQAKKKKKTKPGAVHQTNLRGAQRGKSYARFCIDEHSKRDETVSGISAASKTSARSL